MELTAYPQKAIAVTVACHVISASGKLVDVDIPELSESPWPGSDISEPAWDWGGR